MRFSTLQAWLDWQETLHPYEIELGLDRVRQVFHTLHPEPLAFVVITVAGTNGKGSSIALLEAILLAANYRVGTYTSPHLLNYNERVRLNGKEVNDQTLMASFQRVDDARGQTSLTYFEFGTLAALDIFIRHKPDVVLLEVGLGGRLDAVNIIDADVALITAIGLDHMAWLGEDRESIAREKAGIMRPHRPVVCSDPDMPRALIDYASDIQAQLYSLGRDFSYQVDAQNWSWIYWESNTDKNTNASHPQQRTALPLPPLKGMHQIQNAAGVLMVLQQIGDRLPVSQTDVRNGLMSVSLPGRFQLIPGEVNQIFDVAHNPDGVRQLSALLGQYPVSGKTHAVVGIMADKNVEAILAEMLPHIQHWYVTDLKSPRAATAGQLEACLTRLGAEQIIPFNDVAKALAAARKTAVAGDRIVVFGSFYTVAEGLLQSI